MAEPLPEKSELLELRKLPPLTLVTMARSFVISRLEKTACVDLLNGDQRVERRGLELLAVVLRALHEGLSAGGEAEVGAVERSRG